MRSVTGSGTVEGERTSPAVGAGDKERDMYIGGGLLVLILIIILLILIF
jgi:hypothetical protein